MTNTREPDRASIIAAAIERLQRATDTLQPCEPVRDLLGRTDVDLAYAVQHELIAGRLQAGARMVGRKIGLTSPAVQTQLGVDRPDFGVLLDDMEVAEGGTIPQGRLLQPKAEAEIAFVLAADLDTGLLDVDEVSRAVAYAVASIEIVDSRILAWDIALTDTVADNASSGMYVLGTERVSLDQFNPMSVTMSLERDGSVVSTGTGRACLGNPLNALSWLAKTARHYGEPLRRGDVVLSGALGPMVELVPNSSLTASISGLGTVSVSY